MSLFGKKTKVNDSSAEKAEASKATVTKFAAKTEKADLPAQAGKKSQTEKRAAAAAGVVFPKGSAVIKPRITEKSGTLSHTGVYTFDVRTDANSRQISEAIKAAYKVAPVKVSIAPVKSKAMFVRGKSGRTVNGKKAYVYLKKGDTIEFI